MTVQSGTKPKPYIILVPIFGVQELAPYGDTHNHGSTPEHDNGGQEDAWANFPKDDGRRRLEDDVWDEENQCDQTISIPSAQFEFGNHAIS